MPGFFLILGGQDHGTDQHALEGRVEGRHTRGKAGQISRFFRIYFAGVVKSEDVMGGGEAVEAALGGGERVEGRATPEERRDRYRDFSGFILPGSSKAR